MIGWLMALALAAVQDEKPLAGYLPPAIPLREPREKGRPDRPHGKLFISPMGEPFRGDDPIKAWFDGADADHDGVLTRAEFVADAMRFFATLDRGKDGEIDPDDITYYETVLVPEIRVGGAGGGAAPRGMGRGGGGGGRRGGGGGRHGGGGPGGGPGPAGGGEGAGDGDRAQAVANRRYADTRQGAARYGFFDYPEPITVADTNFNRGVDAAEFKAAALDRFATLDKKHDGHITRAELPRIDLPEAGPGGPRGFGGRPRGDGPPPGAAPNDE